MSKIFHTLIMLWLLWIAVATLLAWMGVFYGFLLWIFVIIGVVWFLWQHLHRQVFQKYKHWFFQKKTLFWLVAIGYIIVNTCVFFQPQTLFEGRDQGSISHAAFLLSQHHSFSFERNEAFSFFATYGEGKALNFPGFFYDKNGALTPQFPHPPIAWYASFLALGIPSPTHIMIANSLALLFFAVSFFYTLKRFTSQNIALLFTILALFAFPIWWFARFSLTETIFLALLWISIYLLFEILRAPSTKTFALFILALSLLSITRIEGPVFTTLILLSFFLLSFLSTKTYKSIHSSEKHTTPSHRILKTSSFFIIFIVLIFAIILNQPFYSSVAKAVFQTLGIITPSATLLDQETSLSLLSLWSLLFLYGIGVLAVFGILSFFFLLRFFLFSSKITTKHLSFFATLFILSPSLMYLLYPFISPDHPWMLRRFVVVSTLLLFLIAIAFSEIYCRTIFKKKWFLNTLLFLLFVSQLIPLFALFPLRQDNTLLIETKAFSKNFHNDDLVLIDSSASGSGFVMLPSVLREAGIASAYFFNAEDLNRGDFSHFNRVFLLTNEHNLSRYATILHNGTTEYTSSIVQVSFSGSRITPDSSHIFPVNTPYETTNFLFQIQ